MIGLTAQERSVYDAIIDHKLRAGTAPTLDEIKVAVGLDSKSSVHRILGQLCAKGVIRRLSGKARAIEVVGLELRSVVEQCLPEIRRAMPEVAEQLEAALRA